MTEKSATRTECLLVVDDDVELCDLIRQYLEPDGFEIEEAHDGERGLERALSRVHSLVLLDVMLPSFNGFDVLRQIRAQSDIPVLMLTARGDDVDRIVGLEIGADDYLAKPFNPRELLARIRAILRRSARSKHDRFTSPERERLVVVGDVEMDVGARLVRRDRETIDLTGVEFALLEMLLRSAGSVVTRENLSRTVLGRTLTPYDRSLDMHISNLRKKLGHRVCDAERINTVRGVGYLYTVVSNANEEPPLKHKP